MIKDSKDINYYKEELVKAEAKYKASFKTNSCKAIMDSYHEMQKIKKQIQALREESGASVKDDDNSIFLFTDKDS